MKRTSLRTRIFASYFLLIGLSSGALAWISSAQIFETVETLFVDELYDAGETAEEEFAEPFFVAIEEDLDEPNAAELARIGRQISNNFEVSVVLYYEEGPEVLYTSELEIDYDTDLFYENARQFWETGDEDIFEDEALNRSNLVVPILGEDDELFAVAVIGKVRDEYDALVRTRYLQLIGGTGAAALVLLVVFGGLLARAITQPLTDLRDTARQMAAGKLDTRANIDAPSEVSLLAEDFNAMADAVENMMAEQRAFANNAAHELRTPLTGIRLRTETLLEDDPDDELRDRYVEEIHHEVQRFGRLIDDLRILSRADSVSLKMGQEQIDLHHLMNGLKREFTPRLREKGHEFVVYAADQPYMMEGGNSHIRTVLRNLIENAVKYTPDNGRIEVTLDKAPDQVSIRVKDNGVGISAEDLPQLFKRFYRVDKAHSRQIPGSGLGLSLVKSIVALYHGKIDLHSDGLSRGTTVTVTFPLNVVKAEKE